MNTELAYRTTSPAAVEWFVTNERNSCKARREITKFETEVAAELGPTPGEEARHIVHLGGRVIGVEHGDGEATPRGMRLNVKWNAFVAHPVDHAGKVWRKRIRELPRVPDVSTATLIGVPWQIFSHGEFCVAKMSAETNSDGEVVAIRQEWQSRDCRSTCLRQQSLRDDICWVELTTIEPFLA